MSPETGGSHAVCPQPPAQPCPAAPGFSRSLAQVLELLGARPGASAPMASGEAGEGSQSCCLFGTLKRTVATARQVLTLDLCYEN